MRTTIAIVKMLNFEQPMPCLLLRPESQWEEDWLNNFNKRLKEETIIVLSRADWDNDAPGKRHIYAMGVIDACDAPKHEPQVTPKQKTADGGLRGGAPPATKA